MTLLDLKAGSILMFKLTESEQLLLLIQDEGEFWRCYDFKLKKIQILTKRYYNKHNLEALTSGIKKG